MYKITNGKLVNSLVEFIGGKKDVVFSRTPLSRDKAKITYFPFALRLFYLLPGP